MVDRRRLTDSIVRDLEPGERRRWVYHDDPPSLALMVTKTGAKTWYFVRKVRGRWERVRLGSAADLKLRDARRLAAELAVQVAAGHNPAEERRRLREASTLGELWTAHLEHRQQHNRSWKNDERQWNKHVAPALGSKRLSEIRRQDIARLMSSIRGKKGSGPIAANRVRALISATWEWGAEHLGLELPNPCRRVKRFAERPRERYLAPAELRRFWQALNESDGPASDAVAMLLLTGQRKGTICGLKWSEVDFRDALLRIPGDRMKSGRDQVVPVAPEALEILKRRHAERDASNEYVFPAPGKRGHLYDLRAELKGLVGRAEIEALSPHDLRRTWATICRECGRDPGPILGHAPQGVTARHYALVTPGGMAETMRVTVARILRIVEGREAEKVVRFPS